MLGGSTSANATASLPGFSTGANAAAQISAGTSNARAAQSYAANQTQSSQGLPYVLLGLAAVYVIWAVVIQHERLRESLQPSNVAANFHNFVSIGLMASIFLVSAKLTFTKLTAWGVPGAALLGKFFAAT